MSDGPQPAVPLQSLPLVPPAPVAEFRLCVDWDRNGSLDNLVPVDNDTWRWGRFGHGAVVLCNNDSDRGSFAADNADDEVNAGNDGKELAPIGIEHLGPPAPAHWTGYLELPPDQVDFVRVFDSRSPGSAAVLGKDRGPSYELPDLDFGFKRFWMEATRYPGTGFDGVIRLTFRLSKGPGTVDETQTAAFRVAPWLMPNHCDPATRVFVVDAGPPNRRFRDELLALVTTAGCTLQLHVGSVSDVWMQDCMEIGYSNLPGALVHGVMRAPRDQPLQTYPRTLLAADIGYHETGTPERITFNSTGNLECTPPVTSRAGKRYPLGRIYYGPGGRDGESINADLREFLRHQVVQAPIKIDTNWLTVGHVDEMISIVPAPTAKGFKLLLASPDRAYAILRANRAANGSARMLLARRFPNPNPLLPPHEAEVSIAEFLGTGIAGLSLTAPDLERYNAFCQTRLNAARQRLESELGLDGDDIVPVAILYMRSELFPPYADALTAGMVNMLVLNGHCIVPKPFGPVVGGVDLFEQDLRSQLEPLGLTVDFLDDWYEYHVNMGEVHCGTNTLRTPTRSSWWEFEP